MGQSLMWQGIAWILSDRKSRDGSVQFALEPYTTHGQEQYLWENAQFTPITAHFSAHFPQECANCALICALELRIIEIQRTAQFSSIPYVASLWREIWGRENAQLRRSAQNEIQRCEKQNGEHGLWDPGHRDWNPYPEKNVASVRSSWRPSRHLTGKHQWQKCGVAYLPVTPMATTKPNNQQAKYYKS